MFKSLHSEINIPADFSLNDEDFQLRNFFKKLSSKSYSPILQFQVSHFVRILTYTMCILGCTRGAKYSCLTSLKIASMLACIISYIEHTHQYDQAALIQRGSDS